jgi:hypothetical protein
MAATPALDSKLRNISHIFTTTALSDGDCVKQERIVAGVERRLSVVEELSALVTANRQCATRLPVEI